MTCPTTSSLTKLADAIKILNEQIGQLPGRLELKQLTTILSVELETLRTEIEALEDSTDIATLITQAAVNWVTRTRFNQAIIAITNELDRLQTQVNNLDPASDIATALENAALNWVTTTRFNQSLTAVAAEIAALQCQIDELRLMITLGEAVFDEQPAGIINGSNNIFTLRHTPTPANSIQLIVDGSVLDYGADYTMSANTITITNSAFIPVPSGTFSSNYRY